MKHFFSQPRVRLVFISILAALLLVVLFLIPHNPGPYRAVPSQTSLLIGFNGLVRAGQQMRQVSDPAWKEVLQSVVFQHSWQEIGEMEALFHHEPLARAAFAKNTLLAAYSLHPADSLHALFILDVGATVNLKEILATDPQQHKYFPYQFHSQTLFTVHQSKNNRGVVAQKGQLLLFSRYSYLVEDALAQLENARGWWADNQYLGELNEAAGLRCFFRPVKWQAHHTGHLVEAARNIPAMISNNLDWLGIAWDGQTTTAVGGASGFLADLGKWQATKRGDIIGVAPDNTAFLAWAGFDNRSLFFKQFQKSQSVDFNHFVLPWINQEIAMVVTEPLSTGITDDRLLILGVRDSSKARQALTSYGQLRGMVAHEQIGMFEVFGFQGQSLLAPVFAATDQAFHNPFIVLLGNYAVVAPNRPAIEVFIEKYIANQTLAQNTDFLQLTQQLQSSGRGLIILNGGYLSRLMQQIFQPDAIQQIGESEVQRLSNTGWLAAELTPDFGRTVAVEFSTQRQSLPLPESNIFWKTALGAPVVTRVFTIDQPGMPMGAALLAQDKETQLYCLQPDGHIAWQKHLGSLIISPINAIDYFQNGRKCYILNTKTQVWILDENGKEVSGYPVNLKAPASTGMTVVDFDKNLKFNYFVGSDNGNVYGFDGFGRALEGWNPQANLGKCAGPILHFQHLGKDYLAVLGAGGLLSVFGRDGKLRFAPVQLTGQFSSPPYFEKSNSKPRIVSINNEGVLHECHLDGRAVVWDVNKGKKTIRLAQLNWPGGAAYALLQDRKLTVVKWSGNTLRTVFTRQLNEPQEEIFPIEDGLGLCSRTKRKISWMDQTGKVANGFPLAGTTPYSICHLGHQKLIVTGNGSAIYSYKTTDGNRLSR